MLVTGLEPRNRMMNKAGPVPVLIEWWLQSLGGERRKKASGTGTAQEMAYFPRGLGETPGNIRWFGLDGTSLQISASEKFFFTTALMLGESNHSEIFDTAQKLITYRQQRWPNLLSPETLDWEEELQTTLFPGMRCQ